MPSLIQSHAPVVPVRLAKRWELLLEGFAPRSSSLLVYVMVMAAYSRFANRILGLTLRLAVNSDHRNIAGSTSAPLPEIDLYHLVADVTIIPFVETLLLVGIITLCRSLRLGDLFAVIVGAAGLAALHFSRGLWGVHFMPFFLIDGAAYIRWRKTSWPHGFVCALLIHVMHNLIGTITVAHLLYIENAAPP